MATAKKLEFQAERKAAGWQGGKPQPALHPTDVHAAACPVDANGEAARTAYPVSQGSRSCITTSMAASAATQRACGAGCLEIHHCREGRHRLSIWRCLLFSWRRAIWRSCSARRSSPCALSDRTLPWHHGVDRPCARAGLPVMLSGGCRGAAERAHRKILRRRCLLCHALVTGRGTHFL